MTWHDPNQEPAAYLNLTGLIDIKMEYLGLHIIHSHPVQNIGNVYAFTSMTLCNGLSKVLVGVSGGTLYIVDCIELIEYAEVVPVITDVPFTSIPGKMFIMAYIIFWLNFNSLEMYEAYSI